MITYAFMCCCHVLNISGQPNNCEHIQKGDSSRESRTTQIPGRGRGRGT